MPAIALGIALSLVVLCPRSARGQDGAALDPPPLETDTLPGVTDAPPLLTDPRPPVAPPATLDVGDLWHAVRHRAPASGNEPAAPAAPGRRFVVIAPTIGSKPTTGFTAGLNGNMAFFAADPTTTHISSVSAGFRVSQLGQVLSGGRLAIFTPDDRWFVQGDNRVSWTSLNTYALGGVPQPSGTVNVQFDQIHLYETAYRRVAPGLFVGAGVNIDAHAQVRPADAAYTAYDESAYLAYSQIHGFSPARQLSTGTSVGLLFDTRDNAINARRGVLASTTYRTFFGALGGDSTWQEFAYDVRTYRSLADGGRQTLAFWTAGDFVTGGVAPFWDLPEIAADGRSARGYAEGRYRGEHLMYGEIEYRRTVTNNGLLGFVAFANVTTVDDPIAQRPLFSEFAPAVGGGLRVLLNKRSRTNLCADYGVGKSGSRGFYLAIQEAF